MSGLVAEAPPPAPEPGVLHGQAGSSGNVRDPARLIRLGPGREPGRRHGDAGSLRRAQNGPGDPILPDGREDVYDRRPTRGHAQVPVPRCLRTEPALDDAHIRPLARLTHTLEAAPGWPVDRECAHQPGRLYFLQCRPITTLSNAGSPIC
jgi:hypothetical protein